ncbi:MAG TPA: 7TM diverse intracellular signaling domain-containing protein [Spirochaetota bacterium]|nr:7TM diverse intracellular signaling domain-containing protein [Spirochaetota bacterium]
MNGNFSGSHLNGHLEYFLDEDGGLDISAIAAPGFPFRAAPTLTGSPSFGYSRGALWLRFLVNNPSPSPVEWYLEYNYPITDQVELFIPEGFGFRRTEAGDRKPFAQRPVEYRSPVFPIIQKSGTSAYYLRVRSQGSLTVPLVAWLPKAFEKMKAAEMLLLGIYYGIMLGLTLYHVFLFISVRERSYLYLLLFIIGVAVFTMVHNGLGFQYLWPESVRWQNRAHPFLMFFLNAVVLQFARLFLSTRERMPRLDVPVRVLAAANLSVLAVPFILEYYYATQISVIMSGLSGSMLIITGAVGFFLRLREARFFLTACLCFLVGVLLMVLRAYGVLPENPITAWTYQIGSSVMILLFSLGVADKINIMRGERERALNSLAESEEKYRTLVENARDGIVLLADEKPLYANPSLISMLGYTEREFYEKTIVDFLPDDPQGRDLVLPRHHERMRGIDLPSNYEARLLAGDGRLLDVIISASRIRMGGDNVIIAIISDVSHLKKAENTIHRQYREIHAQYEEVESLNRELMRTHNELVDLNERLAREKEQLAATLVSIGDGVIATDTEGRIVMLNHAAERLTGWPQAEAEGRPVGELFNLAGGQVNNQRISGTVSEVTRRGGLEISDVPLELVNRKGDERIVEMSGSPVRTADGKTLGAVLAVRDITEKHKLEKELAKIGKIESLGLLAGGIAHDFNNLLTSIIGNLSLAKIEAAGNSACSEILDRIESVSQRAVNLTRQLLTFSRGGDPIKKTASIVKLLEETVSFLLAGSNVRSHFFVEGDIPSVDIDPDQISRVLHNLIINTVQAMPGGGNISIRVQNVPDVRWLPLSAGRYVKISISDEGVGIPRKHLGRIFDPYFTTKEYGSGLGLAITFSIIKKHGGHIDVESNEGVGSTFNVYLRASEIDGIPAEATPASMAPRRRAGRIMVMDDEECILDLAVNMLGNFGYEVTVVRNGGEALQSYRRAMEEGKRFDAVIMDLTIPGGMGGREALVKLKSVDPDVVAIVSSGYSNDPVMANFRAHGFRGVLAKPYTIEDMIQAIDEVTSPEGGTAA